MSKIYLLYLQHTKGKKTQEGKKRIKYRNTAYLGKEKQEGKKRIKYRNRAYLGK